jgi:hypothetical protein
MTNRFNVAILWFSAFLCAIVFMTGCRSERTVQMYNGPVVPPDRLATLVVPWCISLRSVDGMSAPSTMKDEMRVMLKPGIHTLEARYVVLYPISLGDTEKIVSDYVPLSFNGEPGKTYTICSKDPKSLDETRRYAAHVSLWIEDSVGGPVKDVALQAVPPTNTTASISTNIKAGNADIQAQLQEIWEKADEKDREAFKNKVLQQHQ